MAASTSYVKIKVTPYSTTGSVATTVIGSLKKVTKIFSPPNNMPVLHELDFVTVIHRLLNFLSQLAHCHTDPIYLLTSLGHGTLNVT